jgi:hypothetical protein
MTMTWCAELHEDGRAVVSRTDGAESRIIFSTAGGEAAFNISGAPIMSVLGAPRAPRSVTANHVAAAIMLDWIDEPTAKLLATEQPYVERMRRCLKEIEALLAEPGCSIIKLDEQYIFALWNSTEGRHQ